MLNLIDRKTKVLLIVYIITVIYNWVIKTSDILFSTQWAFMKKMNAILYWTTTYASLILDSVYIGQILLVLYCLSGLFMFCSVRSNGYIYLS